MSLDTANALRGLIISLTGFLVAMTISATITSLQTRKYDPPEVASRVPEVVGFVVGYIMMTLSLAIFSFQRLDADPFEFSLLLASAGLILSTVSITLLARNVRRRRDFYRKREDKLVEKVTDKVRKETIRELVHEDLEKRREEENE